MGDKKGTFIYNNGFRLYIDNRAKQVSGYIGQDRIELLDFLIRQADDFSRFVFYAE